MNRLDGEACFVGDFVPLNLWSPLKTHMSSRGTPHCETNEPNHYNLTYVTQLVGPS